MVFLSFGVQYAKCILKDTTFNELEWFWGRLSKNQSEGSFTLSLSLSLSLLSILFG